MRDSRSFNSKLNVNHEHFLNRYQATALSKAKNKWNVCVAFNFVAITSFLTKISNANREILRNVIQTDKSS